MSTAVAQACRQAVTRLLDYCRAEGWKGYDPYDGLNSPLPARGRLMRTALTQLVKRSPLNLRPVLGIKKELNPKGLALFARSAMLLTSLKGGPARESLRADLAFLMGALDSLRSTGYGEACWGYNFDWQSRAFFAPRGTPNVVCTTFAANAYLDWYELTRNRQALDTATSSAEFLLQRLNRSEDGDGRSFSYTPLDRSRVHNVNLLAAELLARLFHLRGDRRFKDAAIESARYTLARQRPDGNWPYGEADSQQWIDGFHTGFVIVSLRKIIDHLAVNDWQESLLRAFYFYRERLFLADSTPKYYHDKLYPIDVHSAAQAVITFTEMADLVPEARELAERSALWAINNLQDSEGFFYFQRHRFHTIKIPYIRWSQAWMLYALSLHLTKGPVDKNV